MKAIILAAGKGERLKEITQSIPKPMIEYKGKPLLQHNIELCKDYGIKEIFINLHHLPERITEYFGDGKKFGVDIKYSYENVLLGTAGAVKKIANNFWNTPSFQSSGPFFVIYGDNYSNFNLNLLTKKQKETGSSCIIAFHYREDVSHSGAAEFDQDFRIKRFIEKPEEGETDSHWVNAGIYLLSPVILSHLREGNSDFGKQVFPYLIKNNFNLYGVCEKRDISVFDTPEMYKKSFKNLEENDE